MWRTFAARTVHDLGKAVHLATMYADPTSPPAPDEHPLTEAIQEISGKYYRPAPRPHEAGTRERRLVYDESLMSADLDSIVESDDAARRDRIG